MQLICVPPDMVTQIWTHVSGLVYVALKKGGISAFAPIEAAVLSGEMLLWVATEDAQSIKAAAVTCIEQTEWRRVCCIVACGGRGMDNWLPLIGGLEDYAKGEDCRAMRIIGREGWQKALPDYQRKRVILEKAL